MRRTVDSDDNCGYYIGQEESSGTAKNGQPGSRPIQRMEDNAMQKKFEDLFYEFTAEKSSKDWLSPDQIFFRGSKDMPGATMHCGFQVVTGPAVLLDQPICHTFNAHMVFLGATFPDVFKSFDAEIHFYMGKTLDTMEKIVITEPTILKIPKGLRHRHLR